MDVSSCRSSLFPKVYPQYSVDFLILNFRSVLNVVCFLLRNSPEPEFYMSTFRNTLFHLHRQVGKYFAYEDGTECSEKSTYKIQTQGNYPEENIQHSVDLLVDTSIRHYIPLFLV